MVSSRYVKVQNILLSNFSSLQYSKMHKLPRTTNSKAKCKNAATQTSDTDTMLEIARLQEQVKLLQIENDHLRKYTSENPLSVLTSITPAVSPTNVDKATKHIETKQKSLQNQSLQSKSKMTVRGCTCKGKCSSKICGCVKKNAQCGEWCKCNNDTCQNQEDKNRGNNKENLKHNKLTQEHTENHPIINKHLANANQIKVQNGLFSPDITVPEPYINLEQFDTAPLYFGSSKKLTFESDEEPSNRDKSKNKKIRSRKVEYDETKIRRHRRGKEKQKNFEVNNSEHVRKFRSTSNEEKHRQNCETTKKQALRRYSSTEISVNEEELEWMISQGYKHVQNVKDDMVSLKCDQQTPRGYKSLDTKEDKEDEFDPMKPKHELPRTPISSDTNETISSSISNTSLPTPIITTQKQESEIPAELSQPEVNWEEYQSLLVPCHKCKRKFHPFRIEKHVSCCKKI